MPDAHLISAVVILTLGVTIQTAVGFGLGLFAVPVLVWSGRPLPEAVALLLGAGAIQTGMGAFSVRAHIRPRLVLPVALSLAVGIPIGQAAMAMVVGAGDAVVKQAIGGMLLVVLISRAVYKPMPRQRVAAGWGYAAGLLGGFLAGLVGMGGPPLVIFAMLHKWSKDEYRAFIWTVFFCTTPVLIALLAWRFGAHMWLEFATGLAMIPCVWLGSRAGLALTHRWEMQQLQLGANILLYGMAISSIVGPLL